MKLIVSIILCIGLCLGEFSLNADEVTTSTNNPPENIWGGPICIIALTAVVIGGYFVVKAFAVIKDPAKSYTIKFVLQKDRYDNNWSPVFTNTVTFYGSNAPIELFREQIIDSAARYKITEYDKLYPN